MGTSTLRLAGADDHLAGSDNAAVHLEAGRRLHRHDTGGVGVVRGLGDRLVIIRIERFTHRHDRADAVLGQDVVPLLGHHPDAGPEPIDRRRIGSGGIERTDQVIADLKEVFDERQGGKTELIFEVLPRSFAKILHLGLGHQDTLMGLFDLAPHPLDSLIGRLRPGRVGRFQHGIEGIGMCLIVGTG